VYTCYLPSLPQRNNALFRASFRFLECNLVSITATRSTLKGRYLDWGRAGLHAGRILRRVVTLKVDMEIAKLDLTLEEKIGVGKNTNIYSWFSSRLYSDYITIGNYSTVWLGKWKDQEVAIKRLTFSSDQEMNKYTERELIEMTCVSLLLTLSIFSKANFIRHVPPHPNIVSMLGICFDPDGVYLGKNPRRSLL